MNIKEQINNLSPKCELSVGHAEGTEYLRGDDLKALAESHAQLIKVINWEIKRGVVLSDYTKEVIDTAEALVR